MPTDRTPSPRLPAAVGSAARETLYLTLGLSVLGIQRFQAERPGIERTLTDLGLPQLAAATRLTGEVLEAQVNRLLGARPPKR